MTDSSLPKVGVGVTIFKEGKILLTQRKNAHGAGEFASPGGHLEFGESFADCARRETLEETGLVIENIRFQYLANLTQYPGKHYVHIGLVADWAAGEPQTLEPEKATEWKWYSLDDLPTPLFKTWKYTEENLRTGQSYFDSTD